LGLWAYPGFVDTLVIGIRHASPEPVRTEPVIVCTVAVVSVGVATAAVVVVGATIVDVVSVFAP